jgi:hypothetical protein
MFKSNQMDMELKIRELTYLDEPSPLFVHTLWLKMKNLDPQVRRISEPRVIHWRPVWIVLLVLVIMMSALFIGFGPQKVYGFIRQIFGFSDAGLQAVQEAGLVTDLDISSQPTVVTAGGSDVEMPKGAHQVALSQTIDDLTVTLDWAYVDEGRLALGFSMDLMPSDLLFDVPRITYAHELPSNWQINNQSMTIGAEHILFISYQVIQVDFFGEQIDFSVDLPLISSPDEPENVLATFHFDLKEIPVYRGMTIQLQQTNAVSINNVEVILNSIHITPSNTELDICYDFPPNEENAWYLPEPTLQIGNGLEETGHSFTYQGEENGKHCARINFRIGNAGNAERLIFKINSLYVPLPEKLPDERIFAVNEALAEYGLEIAPATDKVTDGLGGWVFVEEPEWESYSFNPSLLVMDLLREKMTGPWTFYVDIPTAGDFNPDMEEIIKTDGPPIGSQTLADVTVTLDWVFVDALRAGVGYTVTGLPDVPEASGLQGEINLYDSQGLLVGGSGVGSSTISRVEDQPGTLQGTWSVGFLEPLTVSEAQFQLVMSLGSSDMRNHIAGFPIEPEATPYPPYEFPPDLPEGPVGTFTFDFTAPIHPLMIVDQIPPVTVNGTQVWVPRAEVTASMSKVMICYEKPSDRDWWIMNASVHSGDEGERTSGGRVLYDTDYTLKPITLADLSKWEVPQAFLQVEHGRCLLLDFLQGQSNPSDELVLEIESMEISPPEVFPEDELAAVREILRSEGIEFNNEISRSSGGGGGGINFTVLPEGMSWETAYQKFIEALGYVHTGPWEITLISKP